MSEDTCHDQRGLQHYSRRIIALEIPKVCSSVVGMREQEKNCLLLVILGAAVGGEHEEKR